MRYVDFAKFNYLYLIKVAMIYVPTTISWQRVLKILHCFFLKRKHYLNKQLWTNYIHIFSWMVQNKRIQYWNIDFVCQYICTIKQTAEFTNSFIMLKSQLLNWFIYFTILITCLSVFFKQAADCVKRYEEQETSVNHELQR